MTSDSAIPSDLPRRFAALGVCLAMAAGAWTLLDAAGSDDIRLKTGIFSSFSFFCSVRACGSALP